MLPGVTERFDTGAVAPDARIAYWCDAVARTASPIRFRQEAAQDLHCSMTCGAFERFTVYHADTTEVSMFRGKEQAGSEHGLSSLYLQLEGEGELLAIGRKTRTAAGSLILFDGNTPYRYRVLSPVRAISIGFPSSLLAARIPDYRDLAMRPIDGNVGLARVLQDMLRAIDALFVAQGLREFPRAMFMSVIELVAALVDDAGTSSEQAGTLVRWAARVRAHVEANLDDPDLTPASIAQDLGISARYLRLIFANGDGADQTLRRFIVRRRLEECAARLADPSLRNPSITQLAHSWGFSDSSYFSRRFAEHFGATPRAYRQARMDRAEAC